MKIRRYKNLFCMCAVAGCHHAASIGLKMRKGNRYKDFYVCIDCSFKIYESITF